MHGIALLLHVLAATIWTGGHLILALTVLPPALKEKSPSALLRFESGYERVGIPALVIQVVTGLMLAFLPVTVPEMLIQTPPFRTIPTYCWRRFCRWIRWPKAI